MEEPLGAFLVHFFISAESDPYPSPDDDCIAEAPTAVLNRAFAPCFGCSDVAEAFDEELELQEGEVRDIFSLLFSLLFRELSFDVCNCTRSKLLGVEINETVAPAENPAIYVFTSSERPFTRSSFAFVNSRVEKVTVLTAMTH